MAEPLIHLTDAVGKDSIERSSRLSGKRGVFAVPKHVEGESAFWKSLRTGLSPSRTTHSVGIPPATAPRFRRSIPCGLYSLWKWVGEVFFTSPGVINLKDGTFEPATTLFGPRVLLYGVDALCYLVLMEAVLYLFPNVLSFPFFGAAR